MKDWHQDPRWVDWGDLPVGANPRDKVPLIECPKCGRSGEPYSASLGGMVDERHPLAVVIHGGVYYESDPYEWYFGVREPKEWAQWLAIREEHAVY